jgi:hypothetical protein
VRAKEGVDSAATSSIQKWQVKIGLVGKQVNQASPLYKVCAYFDFALARNARYIWPYAL